MLSLSSVVEVRVNAIMASVSGSTFSTGLILAPAGESFFSGESASSQNPTSTDDPSSSGTTPSDEPDPSSGSAPSGGSASPSASISPEDRLRLFASAEDMLTAGFAATDPAYLAALAYFAASPAPDRVYVGLYAPSESIVSVLRDILSSTSDFYGFTVADPDPAAALSLLSALATLPGSGRYVFFCGAAGSVSEALSPDGILKQAYATGSSRVLTVYGSDLYAPAAVMGTAMGLARTRADSSFALCYQTVPGMLPTDLTESEIASFRAVNANVYITRGGHYRMLELGAAVSGARFDEVLFLDRIAADLQSAALSLLTSGSGKLPQTDETSAVFMNRFSAVLAGYTAAGILATSVWRGGEVGSLHSGDVIENGYLMWADSYDTQSDSDRAAHKAMPIHAALCFSGSVETLLIDVDVSL